MNIPTDPYMLLSFINLKLRDDYENLDDLCLSLGIDKKNLEEKLSQAGFSYVAAINQFR